jgi:nicotinamidase-related amidase
MPQPQTHRLAVLLIDMQAKYLADVQREARARVAHTQLRLIGECTQLSVPLIVVEFKGYGKTVGVLQQPLSSLPHHLVEKSGPNAFGYTRLGHLLRQLDVTKILLTGVYTGGCILNTAHGAKRDGFAFVTAEDVVAEHKDAIRQSLPWLGKNGTLHKKLPPLASLLS